jgi:hypothetical protein
MAIQVSMAVCRPERMSGRRPHAGHQHEHGWSSPVDRPTWRIRPVRANHRVVAGPEGGGRRPPAGPAGQSPTSHRRKSGRSRRQSGYLLVSRPRLVDSPYEDIIEGSYMMDIPASHAPPCDWSDASGTGQVGGSVSVAWREGTPDAGKEHEALCG